MSFNLDDNVFTMNADVLPINVEVERDSSSANSTLDGHNDLFHDEADLDHEMDEAEETVHRKLDTNLQRISKKTLTIRPTRSPHEPSRSKLPTRVNTSTPVSAILSHGRNGISNGTSAVNGETKRKVSISHGNGTHTPTNDLLPEIRSRKTSINTVDGERLSPHYAFSPTTGEKTFHMEFDTEGYTAEQIRISIRGRRLVIKATQNECSDGRQSVSEFCRRIKLPSDVDLTKLNCCHDPDRAKIIAEAPLLRFHGIFDSPLSSVRSSRDNTLHHLSMDNSFSSHAHNGHSIHNGLHAYNVPRIRNKSNTEALLEVDVEVGRVFKALDVTVKVLGDNKLVVQAARNEESMASKLKAEISREFLLEQPILPETLKADFGSDGILRINAHVKDLVKTSVNNESGVNVEIIASRK